MDTLEQLAQEELQFELKTFDAKTALSIGNYVASLALHSQSSIGIEIYANQRVLFQFLNDACAPDHINWLRRKRNTVLQFQHSTKYVQCLLKNEIQLLSTKFGYDIKDYAIHQGGFPIRIQGVGVIGAISISGLSQPEDHALAMKALQHVIHKESLG